VVLEVGFALLDFVLLLLDLFALLRDAFGRVVNHALGLVQLVHALVVLLEFGLDAQRFAFLVHQHQFDQVLNVPCGHKVDVLVHDFLRLEELFALLVALSDEAFEQRHEILVLLCFCLDVGLCDFIEHVFGQRPEMDDGRIQEDRGELLEQVFVVGLVGAEADDDLQVAPEVLLLDFVLGGRVHALQVAVFDFQFAHDVQLLLLRVVERQVAVVEKIVDVVRDFVVVEVGVLHDDALAHEVALEVRAAGDDDLLELVLELDLALVALELDDLEVADAVAGQVRGQRRALALEADHDGLALVLEERAHGVAEVAHGFVEQDEVELVAPALVVEVVELVLHLLLETVVELVGVVRVLPGVLELLEHLDGLRVQLGLPLPLDQRLLVVRGRKAQLLLLERARDDFDHALEVSGDVRGGVEPVEELAVEFVLEHLEELVVADLVLDVDGEDALEGAHDVLEGEDVLLVAAVRLELGLHHAQRLHRHLADVLDPLRVLQLLDLLRDGRLQAVHLLAVLDDVHQELHELVREALVRVLVAEQLARADADQRVLLDLVPLERLLVLPAGVFRLLAQQLVGRAHVELVLLGLVHVVDDEGHAHVGVEVDELLAHLGLHLRDHVVQLAAREAVLQLELVRQLGLGQQFHRLADGQRLGVGVRADHEQVARHGEQVLLRVAVLQLVRQQVQVLEELPLLRVVVGHQADVDEVQQLLRVEGRQDHVLDVVELVQERLGGHVVHALQVALVVHHDEVLDRAVVEHVLVRLDELVEPLAVGADHPQRLHDRHLEVPLDRHVLLDDLLVLQLFQVLRELEFAARSGLHEMPEERVQEFALVDGDAEVEVVELVQHAVEDLHAQRLQLLLDVVVEVGDEAADFVVDLAVARGEVDDAEARDGRGGHVREVGGLEEQLHVRPHADAVAVGQRQDLVVVQDAVHRLEPLGVERAVEHDPLVRELVQLHELARDQVGVRDRDALGLLAEQLAEHALLPRLAHLRALQLVDGLDLRVDRLHLDQPVALDLGLDHVQLRLEQPHVRLGLLGLARLVVLLDLLLRLDALEFLEQRQQFLVEQVAHRLDRLGLARERVADQDYALSDLQLVFDLDALVFQVSAFENAYLLELDADRGPLAAVRVLDPLVVLLDELHAEARVHDARLLVEVFAADGRLEDEVDRAQQDEGRLLLVALLVVLDFVVAYELLHLVCGVDQD